jgi:hypothetical protein
VKRICIAKTGRCMKCIVKVAHEWESCKDGQTSHAQMLRAWLSQNVIQAWVQHYMIYVIELFQSCRKVFTNQPQSDPEASPKQFQRDPTMLHSCYFSPATFGFSLMIRSTQHMSQSSSKLIAKWSHTDFLICALQWRVVPPRPFKPPRIPLISLYGLYNEWSCRCGHSSRCGGHPWPSE